MQHPLEALSVPNDANRRLTGLALGGGLGLIYGLTSQLINRAFLPGVPLYQPPGGPAGNIALSAAAGAGLGLICAWPLGSIPGIFLASALSAAVIVIGSFIEARVSGNVLVAAAVTGVFLALPFWAMLVPLLTALRWGVNRLDEAQRDAVRLSARVPAPLILALLVAAAGALSLYRLEARDLLARTHHLLQVAQDATTVEGLPQPLRAPDVAGFIEHGRGPYQLAWERERIARYRIPRPGRNFDEHSVVVARFANGWNLGCLYIAPDEMPFCKGFEELPP